MQELKDVKWMEKRTGLTVARVYELVRQGILPCVRFGRQIRFDSQQIEAWIASGGQALPGGWRQEDNEVRL